MKKIKRESIGVKKEEMVPIRVTKALKDIIIVNQNIIDSMKAAKARADKLLDKYQSMLSEEAERPANRFLDWTKVVIPFSDAVISAKVNDYELMKRYESYIKTLIAHDQEYLITQEQIDLLSESYDSVIDVVLKLESKMIKYKKELILMQMQLIKTYQKIPPKEREVEGHCVFCGTELNEKTSHSEHECLKCSLVPDDYKPEIEFVDEEDFELEEEPEEVEEPEPEKKEKMSAEEVAKRLFGNSEDLVDSESTDEEEEPKPKRKRGRPPGTTNKIKSTVDPAKVLEEVRRDQEEYEEDAEEEARKIIKSFNQRQKDLVHNNNHQPKELSPNDVLNEVKKDEEENDFDIKEETDKIIENFNKRQEQILEKEKLLKKENLPPVEKGPISLKGGNQ